MILQFRIAFYNYCKQKKFKIKVISVVIKNNKNLNEMN